MSTTKPSQGEKWQYGYVRQDDDKPKKKRKRLSKHEDGQEFVVGSSGTGHESVHPDPHVAANSSLGQLAGILRLAPPVNREDEWRIRDGHDPPPAWAKSRGSNELEEGPNVECAKSECVNCCFQTIVKTNMLNRQGTTRNIRRYLAACDHSRRCWPCS